jgi:hypothetical protein
MNRLRFEPALFRLRFRHFVEHAAQAPDRAGIASFKLQIEIVAAPSDGAERFHLFHLNRCC